MANIPASYRVYLLPDLVTRADLVIATNGEEPAPGRDFYAPLGAQRIEAGMRFGPDLNPCLRLGSGSGYDLIHRGSGSKIDPAQNPSAEV